MKYLLLIIAAISSIMASYAKELEIVAFESQPFDLTAATSPRTDLNGNACALLKIADTGDMSRIKIEGNLIGELRQDVGEIHAYITQGTKTLIIKHPETVPLRIKFSDYGVYKLLSKAVYTLTLKITEATNASQPISNIYELLDPTSDHIQEIVDKANTAYANTYYPTAVNLLKQAADRGNADAQLSLGLLLENGITQRDSIILKKNPRESFQLVQKAAQQGLVPAQRELGRFYKIGVGENANQSQSEAWYSAAANKGDAKAREALGIENNSSDIFFNVEQMPEFPGGETALMKYLYSNIEYPQTAVENNVQAKVTLQFVITKDGSIGEVKVVRVTNISKKAKKKNLAQGLAELSEEAIRAVKTLPEFYPGRMNGQPVNVWYTLPIIFELCE